MKFPPTLRVGLALAAVFVALVTVSEAGSQHLRPRGAKEFLASARERDSRALDDLRSLRPLPAVFTRIRGSLSDLGAALDTLGAAQLGMKATSAIRVQLSEASKVKQRALRGTGIRDRLIRAVQTALGHETKAADLLGDAPQSPSVAELPIPLGVFGAFDLALGADGRSVWVCGSDASRIVLYPSLETTAISPIVYRLRPGSFPHGIVVGPDGALYVAETGTNIGGNAIARITPAGDLREFVLPTGAGPWGIAVGPDRKIWFTEISAGKVGRLDPATAEIVEYSLPTANSQPQGIVAGPDGALWGTETAANRIFRLSVDGHATEFRIPTSESLPTSIAAGRGGFLWVSEYSGGKLLRISRAGRIREFALPAGGRPYGLASAPDGNVWFADRGGNRIGLITPAGRVFAYALPTPNSQPTAILAIGPGEFAFTEFVANRVGTLRFEPG